MSPLTSPNAFLEIAAEWSDSYRFKIVKFVCIKENNEYSIRRCIIEFLTDTSNIHSRENFIVKTENILAGYSLNSVKKYDVREEIFDCVKNPKSISVENDIILSNRTENDFNYYYDPISPSLHAENRRNPSIRITPDKIAISQKDKRLLDLELMACHMPFRNMNELLNEIQIPDEVNDGFTRPSTEVILDIPAFFIVDGCGIDGRMLRCSVKTGSDLEFNRLSVGAISYFPDRPARRLTTDKGVWTEADSEGSRTGVFEIDVDDSPSAYIFLNYNQQNLMTLWVRDERRSLNIRGSLNSIIDPSAEILSHIFDGNQNQFESAVCALFHILGTSAIRYGGHLKSTDGPDILAFSGDKIVYAVECTIGNIDNKGKLLKLFRRAQKLSLASNASEIYPIVVTRLSRMENEQQLSVAGSLRISVIDRSELKDLSDQLRTPQTLAQLHEKILSLVPSTQEKGQNLLFEG